MAVQFLTWLEARGLTLATATQADVDVWLSGGTTTHYRLRDFLRWAHAHRLTADLTIPWLGSQGLPEHVLAEDDRWNLLRRCLDDEAIPVHLRVAGGLVLLYGQVPSRIVELTRNHLSTAGSRTYLAIGRQPVLLTAQTRHDRVQARRPGSPGRRPLIHCDASPWLFPASQPGTHLDPDRLATLLNNRVGIFIRPARGGALCELATDLPAPVLAELLGLSVGTATRWTTLAGRDWTDYLATRAQSLSLRRHWRKAEVIPALLRWQSGNSMEREVPVSRTMNEPSCRACQRPPTQSVPNSSRCWASPSQSEFPHNCGIRGSPIRSSSPGSKPSNTNASNTCAGHGWPWCRRQVTAPFAPRACPGSPAGAPCPPTCSPSSWPTG